MKTALLLVISLAMTTIALGQKTYIWKGGKPGRTNDWNCAANWNTYRVPDEFSEVFIPFNGSKSGQYPVIRSGDFEVSSLRISMGARLTIDTSGSLLILNPDYCDDVSHIILYGRLHIANGSLAHRDAVVSKE